MQNYSEFYSIKKRLKIPLKDIINEHSVFVNDEYVFTGKKVAYVIALDPKTGKVLKAYGEGLQDISKKNKDKLPDDAIFVGRTRMLLLFL
jgi:Zn-finger domain-containing protein